MLVRGKETTCLPATFANQLTRQSRLLSHLSKTKPSQLPTQPLSATDDTMPPINGGAVPMAHLGKRKRGQTPKDKSPGASTDTATTPTNTPLSTEEPDHDNKN
jgi:hypothetical protein